MTALKLFSIAENGTPIGIYQGADADAAVLAYAQNAGYTTIADAAYIHSEYGLSDKAAADLEQIVAKWRAELDVEDLQETYECLLHDIRDYAAAESDHIEEILNRHREELTKTAGLLVEGGVEVDYSADLDVALAGSRYRDTVYQETAMILSVTHIDALGLLNAA
ncbi:hypothetical protein GOL26_22670 [Sinorhizobium medicae]|nr:hypothetical protein [Sinorhizobium medicae]MDX0997699.1 hypothetical protein [Sinorhizobium medicae]MDX1181524.1 hypothetical protein [Sinorhizobium medicae]